VDKLQAKYSLLRLWPATMYIPMRACWQRKMEIMIPTWEPSACLRRTAIVSPWVYRICLASVRKPCRRTSRGRSRRPPSRTTLCTGSLCPAHRKWHMVHG